MLPLDTPTAWAIRPALLPLAARGFPFTLPPAAVKGMAHPFASAGGSVRNVRGLPVRQVGRVAVVPLYGTVTQRPNWLTSYGLATSAEQFAAAVEELAADPGVGAVVFDVDSPGGSVAGVPEAATRLLALRGVKPTAAVSNAMNASAAYWLSSAADEVVAAPSSLTGSIGVYTVHEDQSGANDRAGVAVTYVYAGRRKVDGHPDAPLSDPARAAMQRQVDDYYDQFAGAVARHRNASPSAVRDGFGEGDVLTAKRAVGARLADRVDTLAGTVARLGGKASTGGKGPAARSDPHPALWACLRRQAAAEATL